MTDALISRRRVLATGGAASLLLLAPELLRGASALAGPPAISVGFVDTLEPLALGTRVTPGRQVTTDSSLTNALLKVTVGSIHPSGDPDFPAASLDALFAQGGRTVPYYALSHAGGLGSSRAAFVQVPGSSGLRFWLTAGESTLSGGLGANRENGLRAGTYLFGIAPRTWARSATLADSPAQRSLVLVIRPA